MATSRQKTKTPARQTPFSGSSNRTSASMGAAKAKMHFLALVDQISANESPVTITKRGKPVVRMVPVDATLPAKSIFGCMKGTAREVGDIVAPEPDSWEALR